MKQYKNELDQETSTTNTLKATPQYQLLQNQNYKTIQSLIPLTATQFPKLKKFQTLKFSTVLHSGLYNSIQKEPNTKTKG